MQLDAIWRGIPGAEGAVTAPPPAVPSPVPRYGAIDAADDSGSSGVHGGTGDGAALDGPPTPRPRDAAHDKLTVTLVTQHVAEAVVLVGPVIGKVGSCGAPGVASESLSCVRHAGGRPQRHHSAGG